MKLFFALIVSLIAQLGFGQVYDKIEDDNIRIEEVSPRYEKPDLYRLKLTIDTVYPVEGVIRYTTILPKASGFLNDSLEDIKLVVITSDKEAYLSEQYQHYQLSSNEILFLYQVVRDEDSGTERLIQFRFGEYTRQWFMLHYDDSGKMIAVIAERILKKERVSLVTLTFKFIKGIKNKQ